MENITYQIRFLILNDENEVLKNFILTERKYDTREEAAEVAQTICCVLLNHCGWNVFYRIVKPADSSSSFHEMTADGSIVSDDELHEEEENEDEDEEEYEDEEENDSYNELTDEEVRAILRKAHDLIRKKYEDE